MCIFIISVIKLLKIVVEEEAILLFHASSLLKENRLQVCVICLTLNKLFYFKFSHY